jgi:DNA-binding response OmpR family regulator
MRSATKSPPRHFSQPTPEPSASAIRLLDEKLSSVPPTDVPESIRELSRFFPVIVLVPKSVTEVEAVEYTVASNGASNDPIAITNTSLPLNAAKSWLKNSNGKDTFEFGEVKGRFSTMEVDRDGRPVDLTRREFSALSYLIKNPHRVISRDELLNEVWGYENYPCTRTVDTHILRLRKKLEAQPSRPRHFLTAHGAGYKFLP